MARIFRPPALLLLAFSSPFLFGSCAGCPPQVATLAENPNFTTPVKAGRSFLAGLSCDHPQTEYLSMAEGLKARHGATFDKWLIARKQLRDEIGPALSHAHRLEPKEVIPNEKGVLVWWVWADVKIGLLMASQDYWDIQTQAGENYGSFLDRPVPDVVQIDGKRLTIQIEDSILRAFSQRNSISRFILGTEWKVLDVLPDSSAIP